MLIYRACKERYAKKLDGEGARQTGGRWNSKGVSVIYTASNAPLTILETLVHTGEIGLIPDDYVMVEINLPDDISIESITEDRLPLGFRQAGPTKAFKEIGNLWIESRTSLVLQVPSAIVAGSHNFLINPNHPDIDRLSIVSITSFQTFDSRLFRLKIV